MPGTSLFQIILVAANVTFLQAYSNHTVDAVLALLLLLGGVIGAQIGARFGTRLRGEQLRFLLALLLLAVAAKLTFDLTLRPAQPVRRHAASGMNGRSPCSRLGRARLESSGRCAALAGRGLVAAGAAPANGAAVLADLSSHIIAIGGGFTGDSVVLFGSTDGPGDIIAVVRGPERDMTVWRKGKVAGIWVNAESLTFNNLPAFYAVVASRPVDELIQPSVAALCIRSARRI